MYGSKRHLTPLCEQSGTTRHAVRPDDFDFSGDNNPLSSTFGKSEVETSVAKFIQFFQIRGHWCEFTIDELRRFYELKGWNYNSAFFGIVGGWFDDGDMGSWRVPNEIYVVFDESGKCAVTTEFVDRCAKNIVSKKAA